MGFDSVPEHLAGVLHPGMLHNRWDRPMKNGHWYWAGLGGIRNVGWCDVSFADLDAVGEALEASEVRPDELLGWLQHLDGSELWPGQTTVPE